MTLCVFADMKPGPPHGENEVTREDDLNPPFLITATKLKGFVRSKCTVWKYDNFSAIQILREINFSDSVVTKYAIFNRFSTSENWF